MTKNICVCFSENNFPISISAFHLCSKIIPPKKTKNCVHKLIALEIENKGLLWIVLKRINGQEIN
jgi:hypothetical protein